MPDTALEAMEDMANEQTQPDGDQPPTEPAVQPEEPVEKPEEKTPEEPEKPPEEKPEKPAEEEESVLPREDMDELFAQFGEEVVEKPPVYQPPAQQQQFDRQPPPQSQPQAPELPPDVLQVTPQKFMPAGQDFDPMEVHTPGTPSNTAALRAQAEQVHRLNAHERERIEQEQLARQNMVAMDDLEARMERENWPTALRERFWKKTTGNPLVLNMLADGFLLEERKVMRKAKKTRPSGGNGESPVPVSKASRVTEAPASQSEIDKEVDEMFGPKQSSGI